MALLFEELLAGAEQIKLGDQPGKVVLVTATKDFERSDAAVLRDVLAGR